MAEKEWEANIEFMYDSEVQIRRTTPGHDIKVINGIEPVNYFVLTESEKMFPQEIPASVMSQIDWFIGQKEHMGGSYSHDPKAHRTRFLKEAQPGSVHPITFTRLVACTIQTDYSMFFSHRFFKLGELEELLSGVKTSFIKNLEQLGLNPEPKDVYSRLLLIQQSKDSK